MYLTKRRAKCSTTSLDSSEPALLTVPARDRRRHRHLLARHHPQASAQPRGEGRDPADGQSRPRARVAPEPSPAPGRNVAGVFCAPDPRHGAGRTAIEAIQEQTRANECAGRFRPRFAENLRAQSARRFDDRRRNPRWRFHHLRTPRRCAQRASRRRPRARFRNHREAILPREKQWCACNQQSYMAPIVAPATRSRNPGSRRRTPEKY